MTSVIASASTRQPSLQTLHNFDCDEDDPPNQSLSTKILVRKKKRKKKRCQPYLKRTALSLKSSVYPWAPGLCGAPDVPHVALECLDPLAEGNDVGVFKAPPVNASEFLNDLNNSARKNTLQTAANLIFKISPIAGLEVCWETTFVNNSLYVDLPPGILPEGSKEGLVTLLEYAEEELRCKHVVLRINKNRSDRVSLLRVFNFFGFQVLPPGHFLIRELSPDLLHMAYTIELDDEDEDDEEEESEESDGDPGVMSTSPGG